MTTFAEFTAEHRLTPSELSELGLALEIARGGCGSVNGRQFKNAELLAAIRKEASSQEQAGARVMAEILDCAANTCLAKFISDFEREQYRRRSGK